MHTEAPLIWHLGGDDVRMRNPLLKALESKGLRVGAVGSGDGEAFLQSGITYFHYELNRWLSPMDDWNSVRQLAQLIKQHQPDVLHAFDTKPGILGALAARRAESECFIRTITGMGYVYSPGSPLAMVLRPVYKAAQRVASKFSQLTIFQNKEDRDYFIRHGLAHHSKIALVHSSGIDTQALKMQVAAPEQLLSLRHQLGLIDKTVVTLVTRLIRTKGVREYLECARAVKVHCPNVAFLLVGPISSEGYQSIRPKELAEYQDDVLYLGPRDDVPTILGISDVFVLPSYYREGVPRVLLEAGAMGLPLIATDMPGCRDVVKHGTNGLLVPPRDAKALAAAVEDVIANIQWWRSRRALQEQYIVQNFDLRKVADEYAALYWKIVAPASWSDSDGLSTSGGTSR
jgi:glycosyltransferase involved in cell wall biosynthesis